MSRKGLPNLIAALGNRAQQIAHYNFDELGIEDKTPTEQALFCFLIAIEEKKREETQS